MKNEPMYMYVVFVSLIPPYLFENRFLAIIIASYPVSALVY